MDRFDREDEGTKIPIASDRLRAFTRSLLRTLVPPSGRCASVHGELVRARHILEQQLYGEGMEDYYRDDAHGVYRSLAVFHFDTLIANRGTALDDEDVAFFRDVREMLDDDFVIGCRVGELTARDEGVDEPELTDGEREELAALREKPHVAWETVLTRAMRCVANWCIANPELRLRLSRHRALTRAAFLEERSVRRRALRFVDEWEVGLHAGKWR